MKTFGRILIIVVAFAVVMGLMYFVVNGGSNNSNTQGFNQPQFQGDGPRPEFRGERESGGGLGWIFGMIKNIGVVTVIVAMIVLPKNFLQQQRHQAATVQINK